MVESDIASLSFHGETRSAADVTAALGIEPTATHERGEPRRTVSGRPSKFGGDYPTAHWSYAVKSPHAGESGTSSLRELLRLFRGKAPTIDRLRQDFDVRLWWSGMSDSSQGGFVFDVELIRDLAALGCDFYGTVFASEPDE